MRGMAKISETVTPISKYCLLYEGVPTTLEPAIPMPFESVSMALGNILDILKLFGLLWTIHLTLK